MCGIAGLVVAGGHTSEAMVKRMTDRISHRGPDGEGFHVDRGFGIGHRRLSIIDLEGGAQPIANEDGRIQITFNGEIYNYRELKSNLESLGHTFKTASDTEAIVHAYEQWGDGCVERLRGMFAFAIYDSNTEELFLARDRLGIKPLVYALGNGRFAFGSEIQALKVVEGIDWSLDYQALDLYLHLQYIPAPYTIFRHARKLPAGHRMRVDKHGCVKSLERYWQVDFQIDDSLTLDQWTERLDATLKESVSAHLVSDVPFGAFLSGGVDSSAMVGYMSEIMDEPVRTFSIAFDEQQYDESEYAATAAKCVGSQHTTHMVSPDGFDILPKLVQHYGEPFADSSAVCTYFVSQVASEAVKMVVSGDGGDEVFAGYSYFPKMLQQFPPARGPVESARRMLASVLRKLGMRPPIVSPVEIWHDRTLYLGDEMRKRLWKEPFREHIEQSRDWNRGQFADVGLFNAESQAMRRPGLVEACQFHDLHNYLVYDNLTKVDIASMCHSIEVRVPILDHHVVEVATQIPTAMKFSPSPDQAEFWTHDPYQVSCKRLLKRASGRFYPDGFYERKKMGFSMPVGRWVTERRFKEQFLDSCQNLDEFFDVSAIHQLYNEHLETKTHGWRIWSLNFLSQWLEHHRGDINPGVTA